MPRVSYRILMKYKMKTEERFKDLLQKWQNIESSCSCWLTDQIKSVGTKNQTEVNQRKLIHIESRTFNSSSIQFFSINHHIRSVLIVNCWYPWKWLGELNIEISTDQKHKSRETSFRVLRTHNNLKALTIYVRVYNFQLTLSFPKTFDFPWKWIWNYTLEFRVYAKIWLLFSIFNIKKHSVGFYCSLYLINTLIIHTLSACSLYIVHLTQP